MMTNVEHTIANETSQDLPEEVAVELAVRFLEEDPTFAGAEAVKQGLARRLCQARLTGEQRNRLAAVVLRALRHGPEADFRSYARLAPAVTSSIFEAAVTCYAASCEHPVAERAQHVLEMLGASRPGRINPRATGTATTAVRQW